ncbi:MAG: hypothetical protein GY722_17290 [bacterium]|nr:hypothetical protein [bacterium]
MIALDRTGVSAPERWDGDVEAKLPDSAAFSSRAAAFESLDVNSEERRKGFKSYAPEVLPTLGRKRDFPPVWRKQKYVKKALSEMSRGHCAYCQTYNAGGAWGDVEHFRPKSLFPSLAYDWSNYFYSCTICNNTKSDRWPPAGSYVRPDEGDPSVRFVFDEDGGIKEAPGDEDAELTIAAFGLDRDGLIEGRELLIRSALDSVHAILSMQILSVDQKRRLVRTNLPEDLKPFSVAVSQCIRRAWQEKFPDQAL